jgi:hypothetical protein
VTIRRGEQWGIVGPAPTGVVRVDGDAALGHLVTQARRDGRPIPPVFLAGGDLLKSLGGTGRPDRLDGVVAMLPVDIVRAQAADDIRWFVAHVVARRSWWRGEVVAAMNAQYIGAWDVAPRSHPNDGRVDVVRVDPAMSVGDRRRARTRLVHGGHVPHPHIDISPGAHVTLQFTRPMRLWVDGTSWATSDSVELTVEPDAVTVCV